MDGHDPDADIVLLLSNPGYPGMVGRDVEQAASIAAALSPAATQRVAIPVSSGQVDGQTYAAFTRRVLPNSNRLKFWLYRHFVAPRIATWLTEVASDSRVDVVEAVDRERLFYEPLAALAEDSRMPEAVRSDVEESYAFVRRPEAALFTSVEHGDFWFGNVLVPRRSRLGWGPFSGEFHVIDWGGSRLDGYACIDVVRYALSLYRPGSRAAGRLLHLYCRALGISGEQARAFCYTSLAQLGFRLEEFPVSRYVELVRQVSGYLALHTR